MFLLSGEPFGLITPAGPALSVNHTSPIRTLTEVPDNGFITNCFQHLHRQEAELMRTTLYAILDAWWWRINEYSLAPVGALDVFVSAAIGPMYTCKFCTGGFDDPDNAISCVRGHINV